MGLISEILGYVENQQQLDNAMDIANLDSQTDLTTTAMNNANDVYTTNLDNASKEYIAQNQALWNIQGLKSAGINVGALYATGIPNSSASSAAARTSATNSSSKSVQSAQSSSIDVDALNKALANLLKMSPERFLRSYRYEVNTKSKKAVSALKKALQNANASAAWRGAR